MRLASPLIATLGLAVAIASPVAAQAIRNGPLPGPNPLFPPDNWWNVKVDTAPVDANSANFIDFIGSVAGDDPGMHPDFGGDDSDDPSGIAIFGMPYASVPGTQPLETICWGDFDEQSDRGYPGRPNGYPVPVEARTGTKWIEGGQAGNVDPGGDRHLLIVDRDNRILYELYRAFWNGSCWQADSGAIFGLDGNDRRPEGWTSAEAAGLAIFPGLVRYDECFGPDPIRHAIRVTVFPVNGYVYPASHDASTSSNANALPLGARLRLNPLKTVTSTDTVCVPKIVQAMKTYGLIVADNGSDLYFQGVYDTRWDNGVLNPAFSQIHASDFQVIQLGWQPAAPTIPAMSFYTLTPCRLVDTRNSPGPHGAPALPPSWSALQRPGPPPQPSRAMRVFVASGQCGIPASAKAIAVNVTVVSPQGEGHVTLFPGNLSVGNTSTINFGAGQTRANNAVVLLATSGSGAFGASAFTGNGTPAPFVLDVTGYFQ